MCLFAFSCSPTYTVAVQNYAIRFLSEESEKISKITPKRYRVIDIDRLRSNMKLETIKVDFEMGTQEALNNIIIIDKQKQIVKWN